MAEKVRIDESIVKDEVGTIDWEDTKVEVRRFLPMADAMGYINDVVAGCLSEDNEYYPEALDFMRRRELVNRYTNFSLPEDTAAEYKILYGTDLYDMIYEMIECDQLDVLWTAINTRIDMIKNDKRLAVERQLADLYAAMKSLSDILSETVGDVTGEQITDFIKALANNQFSEEKVVSAIFDEKERRSATLSGLKEIKENIN